MSTKQRILDAALVLFNEQGERSVTTNHIAAHLNISPGNLYYHFKNKQAIIFDLFVAYEEMVLQNLQVPEDRELTVLDKVNYLKDTFTGLWQCRFIHRDMEHLLQADEALHARYRDFFRTCLQQVGKIYRGLRDAGMIAISDDEVDSLALNTWIVVTSWFSFLRCNLLTDNQNEISQEMLWGGIYQVFTLERPYLTDEFRDKVIELQTQVSPKPAWLG
ncbi:TetR/AcrR family transcriptional regulator [Bacterioplanoides sp. SCSIO 12839]|uniref:TetR/AcrR family transcriptional regulator n=1 Tax=Bacterioplanoides sp. SCSIO 12839 TaxID=2829569 RepID=UPI00210745C1|nr:TetR/AcrR family transcriptional regulator [Bacterioplanoides sp. SCSIO 12839]UTW48082.1 TetR/AcrR family transcriptional regulator [Bacterioplanoides sp. SCSIO 12839]